MRRGIYVYGVADSSRAVALGPIGIDGCQAYTIPGGAFCAVVHDCAAQPYQSADAAVVKAWVRAHQAVLDEAKRQLGTVIPMGFDTILQLPDETAQADAVVATWLSSEYGRLEAVMERIRHRDEYGVQVFYTPRLVGERIGEGSPEVMKIRQEMAGRSPGVAYLYRQKLEKAVRAETETLTDGWRREFYGRVRGYCDDIVVGKNRKADGDRVMLLNLSCLVAEEKIGGLGGELDRIDGMAGFSVHFSGPWPPYSFVAMPDRSTKEAMCGAGA